MTGKCVRSGEGGTLKVQKCTRGQGAPKIDEVERTQLLIRPEIKMPLKLILSHITCYD